ncbi:Protein of unknown function [Pyronema omphalodes CBS 100304]|uniref:Uncharacterized protein n=1 Tax=Pyronema omphalodes (strain CBS 100304) TaxID=1076935 RepID=U4L2W5_PYROM|nr:Protein of unknown function [Pyronema omphalodes CBS 100304]
MPIRLQYNTIRLFSSTVRRGEIGKESSTRIINDDPASKAADETRPTHGQGKGALTQEVSNKNLDHMVKGQTTAPEYETYSKWKGCVTEREEEAFDQTHGAKDLKGHGEVII